MLTMTFNGHDFKNDLIITGINRNVSPNMVNLINTTGVSNGSQFLRKYYESKVITVGFAVMSKTLSMTRRQLAGLFNTEQPQKLIFSDEPDKYWNAIIDGESKMEEIFRLGRGSVDFLVPDGVAHSITEKSFESETVNGVHTLKVQNDGTVAVPISYRIKHGNHDNGFIGIVSQHGAMQYGKKTDLDGEQVQVSETLISGLATSYADYHGTNYQDTRKGTGGSINVRTLATGESYLALASMGTVGQNWRGGMKMIPVPADSRGEVGADNWYCWFDTWFESGAASQTGCVNIDFFSDDNTLIAGYAFEKTDTTSNRAKMHFFSGQDDYLVTYKTIEWVPSASDLDNPLNRSRGWMDILKSGNTVRFHYWGHFFNFELPQEVRGKKVTKIGIYIGQWNGRNTTSQYITNCHIQLENFIFRKDNVDKMNDIPNRFPADSEMFIDGEENKMYLNNIVSYKDEMKPTNYFLAPPGETTVEVHKSDFGVINSVTAEIREAYL